jgi:hypothetical protein
MLNIYQQFLRDYPLKGTRYKMVRVIEIGYHYVLKRFNKLCWIYVSFRELVVMFSVVV